MDVCAVLFDLDDTLFDHRHCARAALSAARGAHESLQRVSDKDLERTHAEILEVLHLEVQTGRMELDAARVERFARLYRAIGHDADPDLAVRTAARYRAGYVEARREVAGASALLRALRPHAHVVVVSNNLLQEQIEKLRQCRLDVLIDVLVVSEEVGVAKPDPTIFEEALRRANTSADAAVMVGDSWTNDIEGARAAGIRPVWFNPDGAPSPDASVATIAALDPTPETLALILGRAPSSPGTPPTTELAATPRR